jgi:hypothetical protein
VVRVVPRTRIPITPAPAGTNRDRSFPDDNGARLHFDFERTPASYLDRHGSLVSRLCDTDARAWVVFGERDASD